MLISQWIFLKDEKTKSINRLHAVFNQCGIPYLKKSDLKEAGKRRSLIEQFLSPIQAAVAIANRMLTTGYFLVRGGNICNGFDDYSYLKDKLRRENLKDLINSNGSHRQHLEDAERELINGNILPVFFEPSFRG